MAQIKKNNLNWVDNWANPLVYLLLPKSFELQLISVSLLSNLRSTIGQTCFVASFNFKIGNRSNPEQAILIWPALTSLSPKFHLFINSLMHFPFNLLLHQVAVLPDVGVKSSPILQKRSLKRSHSSFTLKQVFQSSAKK